MKDVDKMTDEQRAKLFPIILEKHNPEWKSWYESESKNIIDTVQGIYSIHHYGSTAIPNIAAKPTIDILIEIEPDADKERIKNEIIQLGYHFMSFGREPSMMFVKGYTPEGFAKRVFHIHIYYKGIQEELLFRDYLISHPELAKEYEILKINLKSQYEFDRDGYTKAKSEFISRVTKQAVEVYKNQPPVKLGVLL